MSLERPSKDPRRRTSDIGCRLGTEDESRPSARCMEGTRSQGPSDSPAPVPSCDSPMPRSRYRAAALSSMAPELSPKANDYKSPGRTGTGNARNECCGGNFLLDMVDAAETEATTVDSTNSIDGKKSRRQTKSLRCWNYKARLALVEKVLEHKVFTGSPLSRPAAFAKLLDDALQDSSVRKYFAERTAESVRSYWAKMKRDHAMAQKDTCSSATGSSVELPRDADRAAWMVGMQKLLDEIAGYEATTRGEKRADKTKAGAASEIGQEVLQNCSQRGVRGTPLDYSADESSDTESGDDIGVKRKHVGHCSETELLTEDMEGFRKTRGKMPEDFVLSSGESRGAEDGSLAARDSTELDSHCPLRTISPASGERGKKSDASMIKNAGGSSSNIKTKRKRRTKFSETEDENFMMFMMKSEETREKLEKERQLREDARLAQEQKRWEQEREYRLAREAFEREERKHDRELTFEIEKARLAAEDRRMTRLHEFVTQQTTMMVNKMQSFMKSKE